MRLMLVFAAVCASRVAMAAPSVQLQVDEGRHQIVATIDGAGHAPLLALGLRGDGAQPPLARAIASRDYAHGDEPLELALVIEDQEFWIAPDDSETDELERYPSLLHHLELALDHLDLAASLPPGSMASVVTYDTGASFLMPPAPASRLTGAALGTERDYRGRIGSDLVQGVELAMSRLEHSTAPRRALLVIGDGNDTNNEAARSALAELKKRAARLHIATYAVVLKSRTSLDGNVMTAMTPRAKEVRSIPDLQATLRSIIGEIADRSYVTFDASALPWDGRLHDLALTVDGDELDSQLVVLPARAEVIPWWRHGWLAQLLAGLVLAGAWVGFARWRVHQTA